MRLFGHHIALPVAVLALCDLFLFLCSLLLALWTYPMFRRAGFLSADQCPLIVALAAINLCSLVAAGLYKRDAITISGKDPHHMATATSLIIVGFAAYLIPYSIIQGYRFSNLYALAILTVCFQLVLLFCVRAIFVNAFEIVKSSGAFCSWDMILLQPRLNLARQNDPGYTDIVHYDLLKPDKVVRFRRRSATVLAAPELITRDLPQLVRHHDIDEIVVATTKVERRFGTFWNVEPMVST